MRLPRLLACFLAVSALVLGTVVPATAASASMSASAPTTSRAMSDPVSTGIAKTTLVGFNAGNIISDAVFTNKSTMTEAQIQAFFNSKVARCQGGRDENNEPIVCIKDFTMNTVTRPADAYCSGYSGQANESAARIIYRVAQACNINPQVLIVMLQKEQGLVTHTWPSAWRYRIALGQGCPDTAPCDPNYIGFFHQIYGAARQMQIYMEGKWFQWYAPGKTWNILYNPNANCGSSPVYIANKATSALYYYTPYQPNAAALNAGYGTGDGCSAYGNRNFYNYFTDWFGSTQAAVNNPFGNIEAIQAVPGQFRVAGWVVDRDTTEPLAVHVYVGSASTAHLADLERPDVAAAYPGTGSRHGFDVTVPAVGPGATNICVYAMNAGPGANVLLGCQEVAAMSGSPSGYIDSVTAVNGGVQVKGWAIDPDSAGPTSVHVYVDSASVAFSADKPRPDLVPHFPQYGANHGFEAKVDAAPGPRRVCVYAINVGPGAPVSLGCQDVTVSSGIVDLNRAPIGSLESVTVDGAKATVSGWAIDPDTSSSIDVHLYVGSNGKAIRADKDRPDIGASHPGYGNRHGFSEQVDLPVGTSNVCAYGINTGAGGHTLLGCKSVTVAPPIVDNGRVPFGVFDSATASAGAVNVSGWAIDPDTTQPIPVHIYVDSASKAYVADKARPDVAAAYPGTGTNRGFAERIEVAPGQHNVCVYAINTGPGGHAFLGCRSVTVFAPIVDRGRPPFGNFEAVVVSPGGATVAGWAIDPDTTDPIQVHIYVDSSSAAYLADKQRPDVGASYGLGNAHGFSEFIPMAAGVHQVCVYAINNGAGGHTFLSCRSITVP
ncbi:hypothetical protein RN51_01196 [Microbacterium oxydans]|uniref:Hemagglutinin n=1 Tax=Microbacterium oxydans TaxID=82380 RepID=A0A0F0KXQ0_9MICO|nr:hypothetical protein [Microbacterium oxydans]KJL24031.1 hypothetical protein RN51_01196 [Microbacterium oxydans]